MYDSVARSNVRTVYGVDTQRAPQTKRLDITVVRAVISFCVIGVFGADSIRLRESFCSEGILAIFVSIDHEWQFRPLGKMIDRSLFNIQFPLYFDI